jgi:drug/metabolite transporter (DMT)-like permease
LKTEENQNKSEDLQAWADKFFYIIVGLSVLFWAFAFPLIKIGLLELTPENLAILRLFIASLIFFCILLIKPKRFSKLQKKDVPTLFILGFIGVSIYHLSINYGEQYVSAGTASLIIATIPIFVVIFAALFLSEKISLPTFLGVLISLIGVIIISLWGTPNATIEIFYISGAAAVLLASIVGAMYTILGKRLIKRYNPLSLTAYAFLIGNTGLVFFLRPYFFTQVLSLSLQGWIAVLFLACFPTVLAYTFWYAALEVRQASEVTVYLYFTPVISTFASYLILSEGITIWYIFGGFLVIIGLYVVNRKRNQVKIAKKIPRF